MNQIDVAIERTERALKSHSPWLREVAERNLQELIGKRIALLRPKSNRRGMPEAGNPTRTGSNILTGFLLALMVLGTVITCNEDSREKRDPYVSMGNYDGVAR